MQVIDAMQTQAKALADPSRFQLFRFIADATGPVGVAELTDLLGFNHNAIRQHLAVLVDAGLVTEFNEARKVRGRPRKQYELRADALNAFSSVSGSYERLAALLLEVAETGETPYQVGYRAGAEDNRLLGSAMGASVQIEQLMHRLALDGFEPTRSSVGEIVLNNCPFADVAQKNPQIVCELHRGLLNGQIGDDGNRTEGILEPRDPVQAGCLVRIVDQDSRTT